MINERKKERHPRTPHILSAEEARREWENAFPENVELDEDVNLDQIVKMYPLTKSEIEGAVERAYKRARGERVGEGVWGKPEPVSERITLNSRCIREGIVWALGDEVILERTAETKKGPCALTYWCEDPDHKRNFACWEEKRFDGYVISYCTPIQEGQGFICPKKRRFNCALFRCIGTGDFRFECWDGEKKKFECSYIGSVSKFDCRTIRGKTTFECWSGKYFECSPVKGKENTFICMGKAKEKEFKCAENVKFIYKCMEKARFESKCIEKVMVESKCIERVMIESKTEPET